MELIKGIFLLLTMLSLFSVFSLKAPKGQKAMNGLANAAVATFLVEAIYKYIGGDFFNFEFLGQVGSISGTMGGVAAVIIVSMNMGLLPTYAIAAGVASYGMGILPGFIIGYLLGIFGPKLEKILPGPLKILGGVLIIAPLARFGNVLVSPFIDSILGQIGSTITLSAEHSPIFMGFLLGGIIKMVCTSPLSSMALTAMLDLKGLAMGIAAIACVGGSASNGYVFKKLKLGDSSNWIGVMLEPLTQADVVTRNALPIYLSNFLGGGFSGIIASIFGIVNNAPGTASPIPGLIAPFAYNDPLKVIVVIVLSLIMGVIGGKLGTTLYSFIKKNRRTPKVVEA
jgi:fructose-specific phosphotransferase system IIC component